jgi:hypothetical protein
MSDVKYNCPVCNKQFKSNYELNRHENKKNKCIFDENQIGDTKNVTNLMNIIKLKAQKIANQHDIIAQQLLNDNHQKDKILQLEKQIEQMMKITTDIANITKASTKTINKTNNENSNNTTNNTINNTINITTHGRENIDHITNEQYNDVFKRYKKSVQLFVKLEHFDENNKQNSNIYVSNFHDKFIYIYKNKQWMIENEQEAINELCEMNSLFLMDKFRDMEQKYELNKASKRFDSFIEIMDDGESDDEYNENIEKTNLKKWHQKKYKVYFS